MENYNRRLFDGRLSDGRRLIAERQIFSRRFNVILVQHDGPPKMWHDLKKKEALGIVKGLLQADTLELLEGCV